MSALDVGSLVAGRGAFRVGPFDFAVAGGQVLALVGPNGGGKTSLLRAIAGLDPPRAGAVARPPGTPATLPAPGGVDAPFEAEHLVALGRAGAARGWTLSPTDRRAARDALAALGLEHLARRPFDRLSSGERQLVLLARLRVQDAAMCLLDEPTATLDPAQAQQVEAALRGLADEGRVVVVATHDIHLAARADLVQTVGPVRRFGAPRDVLAPETLAALYGAPMSSCPTCGQAVAGTMRA